MTNEEKLSKHFGKLLTGFALSKAILEDYTKVIAKIEDTTEQQIKDRIQKRAAELFEESKAELQSSAGSSPDRNRT